LTIEVKDVVDDLYRGNTVKHVKDAFMDRSHDGIFLAIGMLAHDNPESQTLQQLTWLGYEIAIDSNYLEGKYR
jgi:hypothetical protein